MARRTGLREFQLSVAERLRTAATRTALSSKLGIDISQTFLEKMDQTEQRIPVYGSRQQPANMRGMVAG